MNVRGESTILCAPGIPKNYSQITPFFFFSFFFFIRKAFFYFIMKESTDSIMYDVNKLLYQCFIRFAKEKGFSIDNFFCCCFYTFWSKNILFIYKNALVTIRNCIYSGFSKTNTYMVYVYDWNSSNPDNPDSRVVDL